MNWKDEKKSVQMGLIWIAAFAVVMIAVYYDI